MKLCSACLLGINCRYNGETKSDQKVLELAKKETLIPVCPEQLGGLTTPRDAAENKDNKVFTKNGKDVTEQFVKGAEEVLKIVKLFGIEEAILKQRSPSCGSYGVTTKLLKENGIKVISEEEL